MNCVEDLEQVLTLDQAQELADFDSGAAMGGSSTQQLLDDLLGRFEEDDSVMSLNGLPPEFYTDSDE